MSLASPMLDARLRDEGERMQRRLLGLFLALSVLTACGGGGGGGGDAGGSGGGGGGGGGGSPPPDAGSPAQGFWSGTTSTGYGVLGAVLENGEYWFMYYAGRVIQGLVHGSGSASNGNFASTDGLDFWANGAVVAVNVAGSYRERESLQGFVTPRTGGSTVSFATGYLPAYDQPATLAALAGTWRGMLATGERFTISVAADGAIGGAGSSGCTFSGTAAPRASGKAVYDVTVRFHGGVCLAGTQTMRGIAAIDAGATPNVLYAAVLDSARTGGFVIAATR